MENVFEAENISFSYYTLQGEQHVLKDISFGIKQGEFVSIAGPSGCGKSTMLSIMAGLIKPSGGKIYTKNGLKTGYMLQQDYLFEWRSIFSNACLGAEIKGTLNKETKEYAKSLFEKYGLTEFMDKKPSALSGGMRQRAALIRTLVPKPDILLLDEPFSALDYQNRLKVSREISSIIKKENKTAVMVTHDISEAISVSDRVIVFSKIPAVIKNEFEIDMPYDSLRRDNPKFTEYFNNIWKELQ
jgi:NitT/TauT family transport system ATP-binding protein